MQFIGAALFALAILHTFSTKHFERLSRRHPKHAGVLHLLAEVEVVFGFWAMLLMGAMFAVLGKAEATRYLDSCDFTEPMFVFAIMVISGARPVLQSVTALALRCARLLPLPGALGFFFVVLTLVPLLGAFITEPAAMTLAAMILSERLYPGASERLRYATLGVLFVNISIGGTLTPFAAPPVLMVAGKWGWDLGFMLSTFGWKAALAVLANTLGAMLLFRGELSWLEPADPGDDGDGAPPVPLGLVAIHVAFLVGVVVFAHYPPMFIGLFLLFLGVAQAYRQHQDRLLFREGLLVAFFLAGLVVLGRLQQWWLQPLLSSLGEASLFVGALGLTALTDNAALTFLGSLVEGLSDGSKYALVAGAVTGGGLTIIANAPNPAGIALLRWHFEGEAVSPLSLFLAAAPPTLVAALAFWFL